LLSRFVYEWDSICPGRVIMRASFSAEHECDVSDNHMHLLIAFNLYPIPGPSTLLLSQGLKKL